MGCAQSQSTATLEKLSLEKSKIPVYIPPLKNVGVIDVYDGDTITIAVKQSHGYYKYKVRLAGIDSPEIRTNNPREKAFAIQSRDFLKSIILYKYVTIEEAFYEKYGRLCGTVMLDGKNINEQMITQGFAVRYNGGKKPSFNK
jgi:endonuclease YncB( thermonuclease family)